MENSQGSSFIPKAPVTGSARPKHIRRKVYLLTYVASILFFGTLIAAGGTFAYAYTLENQLQATKDELTQEKNKFSQSNLEAVSDFDLQLETAFGLLNQHVSLLPILTTLEKNTLTSVQVKGLEYVKEASGALRLKMSIVAPDFNATLLQRKQLLANTILSDGSFISYVANSVEVDDAVTTQDAQDDVVITFEIAKDLSSNEIPYSVTATPGVAVPVASSTVGSTNDFDSLLQNLVNDSDVVENERITGESLGN